MDQVLIHKNLVDRAQIMRRCHNNKTAQAAALALCKKDIKAFFRYFLWTYDPRKDPKDQPFILYEPYQTKYIDDINQDIIDGESSLTEKSRDMGVTWMILGVFLWRWLFFDENFLAGSKTEDDCDTIGDMKTHFERLRYMLNKLPDWMVEACGYDRKNSGYLKIFKENGASIVGDAMTPEFSRQGRFKAILLDEFSFIDKAETVWRAVGDSAPCKLPVSTPNGSNNHFARLRKSGKIKVYTISWQMHPEKDILWYEQQKLNRTDKDVAQELDISYTVSAGTPFYKGFLRSIHVRKVMPRQDRPLILGFDYGWNHPNCIITQIWPEGNWIILDNIFGDSILIDEFAENVVTLYLAEIFPGMKIQNPCWGDPAGRQASDKSKKSSEQILRVKGFPVQSRPSNLPFTNYTARKNIIEKKLKTLIQGLPGLIVNDVPGNQIIIDGFEVGYRFPDENKYGAIREVSAADDYFEHPFNAMEYVAVNQFCPIDKQERAYVEQQTGSTRRRVLSRHRTNRPENAGFGYAKT